MAQGHMKGKFLNTLIGVNLLSYCHQADWTHSFEFKGNKERTREEAPWNEYKIAWAETPYSRDDEAFHEELTDESRRLSIVWIMSPLFPLAEKHMGCEETSWKPSHSSRSTSPLLEAGRWYLMRKDGLRETWVFSQSRFIPIESFASWCLFLLYQLSMGMPQKAEMLIQQRLMLAGLWKSALLLCFGVRHPGTPDLVEMPHQSYLSDACVWERHFLREERRYEGNILPWHILILILFTFLSFFSASVTSPSVQNRATSVGRGPSSCHPQHQPWLHIGFCSCHALKSRQTRPFLPCSGSHCISEPQKQCRWSLKQPGELSLCWGPPLDGCRNEVVLSDVACWLLKTS